MGLSRRALLLAAPAAPLARASGALAAQPLEVVCPLTADPAVLIPGLSDTLAVRLIGGKLYRGLLRWSGDGTLQPDLATAVDVSPDGLVHTVHLRPGVTWHDGGGFGADDVAFSLGRLHRALQPRLRLERVTVARPDPMTVVLTLPTPDPAFLRQLDALRLPIVPQHVHDTPGWALDPRRTTPVGTGPFRVDGWLRLVRFDWFAGAKPDITAMDCPVVPDPAARLALAEAGKPVLLAGDAVDLSAIPRLRLAPSLAVEGDPSPAAAAIAGLRLNLAAKPLDQAELRLGLACAINRATVLREAWAGLGRVATGPVIAGSVNRNDGATLPDYSPRAAAGHFTAAGLRPDDDGIRARLSFLLPPGAPWQALFAVVRASLGQVAIDLAAEPVAAADWARRVASGDYQMTGFTAGQAGDPALDLAPYAASLPTLAALLASGDVRQAQAVLVEQMPVVWLVEPALPVVRDRRLHLPDGALGSFAGASVA